MNLNVEPAGIPAWTEQKIWEIKENREYVQHFYLISLKGIKLSTTEVVKTVSKMGVFIWQGAH